jgi:dynein heavy chain
LVDSSGFYDRDKLFWKDVTDILLMAAAAPPGGGRAQITQRFTRHFNILCLPPTPDESLSVIFESILSGFLKSFSPEIQGKCRGAVEATIEMYQKISKELLPTPGSY